MIKKKHFLFNIIKDFNLCFNLIKDYLNLSVFLMVDILFFLIPYNDKN